MRTTTTDRSDDDFVTARGAALGLRTSALLRQVRRHTIDRPGAHFRQPALVRAAIEELQHRGVEVPPE